MRRHFLSDFDFALFFVTLIICTISLINLYSATLGGTALFQRFSSQLLWMVIGLVVMLLVTLVDYRILERFVYPIYAILILLLVFVLLFGVVENGSRRWLNFGFMRLQPSELMKIGIVLVFSKFFH